jgi:hypothetical protein
MKIDTLSTPTLPFCRLACRSGSRIAEELKTNLEKQGFTVGIRLEMQPAILRPGEALMEFIDGGFISFVWLKRAS